MSIRATRYGRPHVLCRVINAVVGTHLARNGKLICAACCCNHCGAEHVLGHVHGSQANAPCVTWESHDAVPRERSTCTGCGCNQYSFTLLHVGAVHQADMRYRVV